MRIGSSKLLPATGIRELLRTARFVGDLSFSTMLLPLLVDSSTNPKLRRRTSRRLTKLSGFFEFTRRCDFSEGRRSRKEPTRGINLHRLHFPDAHRLFRLYRESTMRPCPRWVNPYEGAARSATFDR